MPDSPSRSLELKTARLTVLIDPSTKEQFEAVCRDIDMTPSQVVRRLIREFLEARRLPQRAAAGAKGKRKG